MKKSSQFLMSMYFPLHFFPEKGISEINEMEDIPYLVQVLEDLVEKKSEVI